MSIQNLVQQRRVILNRLPRMLQPFNRSIGSLTNIAKRSDLPDYDQGITDVQAHYVPSVCQQLTKATGAKLQLVGPRQQWVGHSSQSMAFPRFGRSGLEI
jgi:hypothetical protein